MRQDRPSADAFVYGILGAPPTLDPHDQVLPTDYAVRLTHDALLIPGEGEALELRLAESYRQVDDLTWEFRLRDGVRFSNGRKLTAEAVKWNFARLKNNRKFAPSARLQTYRDADVIDDLTIRFHTIAPDMAWPRRAVQVLIADPAEADGEGYFAPDAKSGTGLYRVVEFEQGGHIRFERSETSWRGRAPISAQELWPYDADALEQAFLNGDVHLGYVTEAAVDRLTAKGIDCQRRFQANVHTVRFNSIQGPFADRRLRKALCLAIDQQAIVDDIYRGNGRVPNQIVGPECFGYDPDMPPFATDPDAARRLVDEVGFTGTLLIDVLEGSAVLTPQGEMIARQLTAVGLTTEINYVDLALYLAKMTRNDPPRCSLIGSGNQYGPGLDADFALDKFSSKILPANVEYDNPAYQAVYDRSLGEPDPDRRRALLQQCARMLIADDACVPVWQPGIPWMVSPRVHGIDMNNFGAGWIDWLKVTMD